MVNERTVVSNTLGSFSCDLGCGVRECSKAGSSLEGGHNMFKASHLVIAHRRTSQGSCSPPQSGKTVIFRANAKFFWQKPAAKNENKYLFFVFIKLKSGIHSI